MNYLSAVSQCVFLHDVFVCYFYLNLCIVSSKGNIVTAQFAVILLNSTLPSLVVKFFLICSLSVLLMF